MEIVMLLSVSFTFVLMVISLCVTYILYRGNRTADAAALPLPPGNMGLPFLGETLEFARYGKRGNPEKFTLDRMKIFPKVFKTSLLNQNTAVFCGASGNKFLFTAKETGNMWFPKSLSKLMIIQKVKDVNNQEIRKIIQEFFNPEFIQKKLVDVMDHTAKQHFDKYSTSASQQHVLVLELSKRYIFHLGCRLFLSLDHDNEKVMFLENLFKDIMVGLTAIPFNFPGFAFHRALKASCLFREEIVSIVKQRKSQTTMLGGNTCDIKKKDMLSRMLDSKLYRQDDDELPRDLKIAQMVLGSFFAGTDTVSSTMTCMVKHLTEHPGVYAQVLQEQMEIAKTKKLGEPLNWEDIQKMTYTWCVANETMRLTPPGQGGFRTIDKDINYEGFVIPKGWKAYWTVNSTHRNPDYFKDPEKFDPSRFEGSGPPPYTFIPFAAGAHICPGRQFAKIEILVFMHNLITRFHFERILPNEKITYLMGATPTKGMPIRLYPRNANIN